MAETAAKTTTPRRAPAKRTTAAKPAAAKPAAKPATETQTPEVSRVAVTLGPPIQETKSYAKFDLKVDADGNTTRMVGNLYAPLGTQEVKVLLVGPAEA